MAKKKAQTETLDTATTVVAVAELEKRRWRVTVNCPTPLQFRELTDILAEGPDEAKAEFCRRNNISGSDHDWTIEPAGE